MELWTSVVTVMVSDEYRQALIMSSQSEYPPAIALHPTDILIDTNVDGVVKSPIY
ncbi:MAG: hypothetical protein GQ571_02530 [Desulfobacterales bacterium]|nr:hypothetical protein [Desulfobacterales bacterium]